MGATKLEDVIHGVATNWSVAGWCALRCAREVLPLLPDEPTQREALEMAEQIVRQGGDEYTLRPFIARAREAGRVALRESNESLWNAYNALMFALGSVSQSAGDPSCRAAARFSALALSHAGQGSLEKCDQRLVDVLLRLDCAFLLGRSQPTTVAELIFELAQERKSAPDTLSPLLEYLVEHFKKPKEE